MSKASPPLANRVLAALSPKANRRVMAALTPVELALGQALYEPGRAARYVYFPNHCVVSLLAVAERGSALEVGQVGREGIAGIHLALGAATSPVRALVQAAGGAMRMTLARFGNELKTNPSLRREVNRCAHVAMATAMQIAACNMAHLLRQRLARWLLMMCDRGSSDEFLVTQDFIAQMLGVRREGITQAASELQRRKLIRYSRGSVRILDRIRLQASSCRCYQVIRRLERAGR